MSNFILLIIIVIILFLAASYIIVQKRRGKKCMGCDSGIKCSKSDKEHNGCDIFENKSYKKD